MKDKDEIMDGDGSGEFDVNELRVLDKLTKNSLNRMSESLGTAISGVRDEIKGVGDEIDSMISMIEEGKQMTAEKTKSPKKKKKGGVTKSLTKMKGDFQKMVKSKKLVSSKGSKSKESSTKGKSPNRMSKMSKMSKFRKSGDSESPNASFRKSKEGSIRKSKESSRYSIKFSKASSPDKEDQVNTKSPSGKKLSAPNNVQMFNTAPANGGFYKHVSRDESIISGGQTTLAAIREKMKDKQD